MSECANCTDEEFCSDACADADEPCLHGELETLVVANPALCRCLDCGETVHSWAVQR